MDRLSGNHRRLLSFSLGLPSAGLFSTHSLAQLGSFLYTQLQIQGHFELAFL